MRLQALEIVGRAGLELGGSQLNSVERAGRTLIESEPYRESGYVLLIEALRRQGNVAEGLLVFERLRGLLRDELGTTPSPETIAVHARLLRPGTGIPPLPPARSVPTPPGLPAWHPPSPPPQSRRRTPRHRSPRHAAPTRWCPTRPAGSRSERRLS